jgi:hypothetical protein
VGLFFNVVQKNSMSNGSGDLAMPNTDRAAADHGIFALARTWVKWVAHIDDRGNPLIDC